MEKEKYNNSISYQVISNNQKIENDKERIRSKFNFNISKTSKSTNFMKSPIVMQKKPVVFVDKVKNLKKNKNNINNIPKRSQSIKINIMKKTTKTNNNTNRINKNNLMSYNYSSTDSMSKSPRKIVELSKMILHNKNLRNRSSNQNSYKEKINTNNGKKNIIKEIISNNKSQSKSQNNVRINKINYVNNLNNCILTTNNSNDNSINNNNYKNVSTNFSNNNFNNKIITANNSYEYNNLNSQINEINNKSVEIFNKLSSSTEEINSLINNKTKNVVSTENNSNYYNFNIADEHDSVKEYQSVNNTSFSGSSKTSEIQGEILNKNVNEEENSNEVLIHKMTKENYIVKNLVTPNNKKLSDNIFISPSNKNDETLQQPFSPFSYYDPDRIRAEVNIFGLLDDDEYNQENKRKMLSNFSNYYFIEDIIKKNDNVASLSYKKFTNLSGRSKFLIFSYVFDNYKNFLNVSNNFRSLIKNMLSEKYMSCISDFKCKYKNILKLEDYQFNLHSFAKPNLKKRKFQIFCLYLKAKVLPNNNYLKKYGDICFEISYKYKIKSIKNDYNLDNSKQTDNTYQSYISKDHILEEYIQIYKFDLKKNILYPIWLCSERDEIFNNTYRVYGNGSTNNTVNSLVNKFAVKDELYQKHLVYSSPIVNVAENDCIVFRIDLIENNKIVDEIYFNDLGIEKTSINYYHKTQYKQIINYDKMRDCESEIAVNIWHDESAINQFYINKNYVIFIEKLKKYFENYFDILETKFDISKLVFIRMTLKAKKIGLLKKSIFCNKDIEIVDKKTELVKECVSINCVNTFSLHKKLKIRQDTIVYFYLTE